MKLLAGLVVVGAGLFLIGLAIIVVVKPELAKRFLRAFASSARAHYTEQVLRLVAGSSLVLFAPSMWYADLFASLGWLIVGTSIGLLLIPWQWHHRFGKWAIPLAIRHMRWYAVSAFALGAFILYGASRSAVF